MLGLKPRFTTTASVKLLILTNLAREVSSSTRPSLLSAAVLPAGNLIINNCYNHKAPFPPVGEIRPKARCIGTEGSFNELFQISV